MALRRGVHRHRHAGRADRLHAGQLLAHIGGGFLILPALILATAMNYAASGLADWRIAALFIAGGIGGGLPGTRLSLHLGQRKHTLARLFAVVVFVVAFYILHRNAGAVFG